MATPLLRARSSYVWLILVTITVVSWALGADHGFGSLVAVVVLALAAVKVRFIGLDFMELRDAPVPLRAGFELYCGAIFLLLSGMYLWL